VQARVLQQVVVSAPQLRVCPRLSTSKSSTTSIICTRRLHRQRSSSWYVAGYASVLVKIYIGFQLQVTGPSAATTSQVDNKDGTITLVYDVTTSGTYQVSVTSGGVNVVGSPSRSIVYSAPADPVKSSVPAMYQDQFVSAKSGRVVFFLVQAVDQYGNVATTGGDSVVVNVVNDNSGSTQAKIVPTVVDTNNGTYSVSFVPTDDQAGSYKIYIDISGTPLVGTPYDLNVQGPDNTNTIIWAVMIPIVVIAIIVLVGLYYMRRRKRSNHYMLVEQDPDSILPSINSGKIASTAKYSLLPE